MRDLGYVSIAFLAVTMAVIAGCVQKQKLPDRALVATVETDLALRWREQGPYRGGRTTAVAGIASRPGTFFLGATGGGLWKTDNAGSDWRQIGVDTFASGSIGAIAVSASDASIMYVGLGESPYRLYTSTYGDGVYRSDDGGETFRKVGLSGPGQIGAIHIHPRDPDLVWVAAQGSPWGPSRERGVYVTRDGGKTWQRSLSLDETAGAVDITTDRKDPRILYASVWDHDYEPWYLRSGGPQSGYFRSMDGGRNWERIENGLPAGDMGKTGIVAGVLPGQVWALLEGKRELGGVYESRDYGDTWTLRNTSGDIRTRPWYYTHIIAHPRDPNTVYSLVENAYISTDGGVKFERLAAVGYDFHAIWINPENTDYQIIGSDAGASISLDGGRSWSSTFNQPTAQLYRVAVDGQIPYRIYAAQQDNSTISLSSRPSWGGPDTVHPTVVGGGETGYISPDPFNPMRIYATTELGELTRFDRSRGAVTIIHKPLSFPEGIEPRALDYRFAVNSPVLASRHRPCRLYHGAQVLLRSDDCGDSWREISGDLSFDERARQGAGGGPYTNEIINHFGAIASIAESPLAPGVIWTGSNDGAVSVTRDHGRRWTSTPAGILPEGAINTVAASPHNPARGFIAVYAMPWNDYSPHLFRSDDYGATWKRISRGLPAVGPARVIREDLQVPELLFAGTETGVFYSTDGGAGWASLQLNMPAVPVTDIKITGADVVISTQGRGIWILHDISPLRRQALGQWPAAGVMAPAAAYRVATNHQNRAATTEGYGHSYYNYGDEIPTGAILDYVLPADFDPRVDTFRLQITGRGSGGTVRSFRYPGEDFATAVRAGHNRIAWDLMSEPLPSIARAWDSRELRRMVPIGTYDVELLYKNQRHAATLRVAPDPRFTAAEKRGAMAKDRLVDGIVDTLRDIIVVGQAVEQQRSCLLARTPAGAPQQLAAIEAWQNSVADPRLTISNDRVNYGASLIYDMRTLLDYAMMSHPPLPASYAGRLQHLQARWQGQKQQAAAELLAGDCEQH